MDLLIFKSDWKICLRIMIISTYQPEIIAIMSLASIVQWSFEFIIPTNKDIIYQNIFICI